MLQGLAGATARAIALLAVGFVKHAVAEHRRGG